MDERGGAWKSTEDRGQVWRSREECGGAWRNVKDYGKYAAVWTCMQKTFNTFKESMPFKIYGLEGDITFQG